MAYVVPAVLGGLAICVVALVSSLASRKRTRSLRQPSEISTSRVLVHSINDDRCTGCDACVAVCPTNVLDLVENKSRVLHFQDCIQCEACMWACPTSALVMHPEGTQPPAYKMPELDEFFQTAVPGQYLIGEVAGKPLVKNAANLGRGVVEHMLANGLRPSRQQGLYDVVIVGSGPGGLSAALTCINRNLSYIVLDKESIIASTVARYPKGKLIMAEPYEVPNLSLLPVFDSSKEEVIPIWSELISRLNIQIKLNETVEAVQRRPDGVFEVLSNGGKYHSQRVVLATGLRGKPRMLGVPGENQAKVNSLLEDPDDFRGGAVCVVGGGDSALEAAIALADAGAKVVLSYRGRSFARAALKNKKMAENYAAERRIKIKYQSQVIEFGPDTVTLEMADGARKRYPNQAAFLLIGADPPIKWLSKLGVRYVERPHLFELTASAAMVQRFLGNAARECPPTAEHAAMLVRGEQVPLGGGDDADAPTMIADAGDPAVSGPRRFLRAATQMFRGSGKLEKPMPLSEFAKRQRRHSGDGRRDQLEAGERTRILRMLRDDGARRADEESKIMFVEDLGNPDAPRRSFHHDSPAPEQLSTLEPRPRGRGIGEPTANGPPPAPPASRPSIPEPPVKQAVIVGLARANAEGPRVSREQAPAPLPDLFRLPDTAMPGDSLGAPAIITARPDERTQFADAGAYQASLEDGETLLRTADELGITTRDGGAPAKPAALYTADFEDEERTMLANFDPQELMRRVADDDKAKRAARPAQPAAAAAPSPPPPPPPRPPATRSAGPRRAAASKAPSRRPPPPRPAAGKQGLDADMLFSDDDIDIATAAIDLNRLPADVGVLLDEGKTNIIDASQIEYEPVGPPGSEDQTNTRVESLSDVDWDLE